METWSTCDGLVQEVTQVLLKDNSNTIIQFYLLLFWCYVKLDLNTEWWASILLGDVPQVPCSYLPLFFPSPLQVIHKLRINHLEFDSWYDRIFHPLMDFCCSFWIHSHSIATPVHRLGYSPIRISEFFPIFPSFSERLLIWSYEVRVMDLFH